MKRRDIMRAERIAAGDIAWNRGYFIGGFRGGPSARRWHLTKGDWRKGFDAAWNEDDGEFGDKTATDPPQSVMGLAGWLYFHMRNEVP